MKNKICLVVLWRQNDWGIYNRRNEALFSEMAGKSSVEMAIHVEPISIPRLLRLVGRWISEHDATLRKVHRVHLRKALSLYPVAIDINRNKYVTSLFVLYPGEIGWLRRLNVRLLRWQCSVLNRFISKNVTDANTKNVIIAYPPSAYLVAATKYIDHDLLIADIVDDVVERFTVPTVRATLTRQMSEILPICKRVYATSPLLQRKYSSLASGPIVFLPNGVSNGRYERGIALAKSKTQARPVVGYVGVLNLEVDIELLEQIVRVLPEFDFVLVGNIPSKGMRQLLTRLQSENSNLRLLGQRHFSEVPGLLETFDVLISMKKADHTTAGNDSMKIYEYLATGKPIVSTSVSPAPQFGDIIYVADTADEFACCVRQAVTENDLPKRTRRVEVARTHSWSLRAEQILNEIENLLVST